MRKLFTLVAVASVMFACSKEEVTIVTPNTNAEKGAIMFNMSSPDFVVKNAAGVRNANPGTPASFGNLIDIKAMLFASNKNMTYISDDIKGSINWTGDQGAWSGSLLEVPTGLQNSLVVFNTAGMTGAAQGDSYEAILFHLVNGSTATTGTINLATATLNEVAVSELVAAQDINVKTAATYSASNIQRLNSKVNVNIGYNQETMFTGNSNGKFRVVSVALNGIPENVNYTAATRAGSLKLSKTYSEVDLNADNTPFVEGEETDKPVTFDNANVLSTLAFPFAANTVTLDVTVEYTTDGTTYTNVVLGQIKVNAVDRNQIINVNIFLKDRTGNIAYDFKFTDWNGTIVEQDETGVEA